MITNDFLKHTPVRLAAAFTILFTLTVIALFAVLYLTLSAELANNIRQRVEETSNALVAMDAEKGFDALALVVANEAKSVRDFNSIFLLAPRRRLLSGGQRAERKGVQGLGYSRSRLAAHGGRQRRSR